MKAVGVIVEYNPFHNGHKFHLEQTKQLTNADCVVAVMSGYFLQRGEPALVSKWARTKMALAAGVDIVIELPYVVSTQKAEHFASGAISILDAIQCDAICFGSENGEINDFEQALDFMNRHEETFTFYLHKALKDGVSYPRAASIAYRLLNGDNQFLDLSKPNNILGFHYVKAIHDQKSRMKAYTIKRVHADYHDEDFSSKTIASATSIRKAIFSNQEDTQLVYKFIPSTTSEFLNEYMEEYNQFHQWEDYFQLLKYKLVTSTPETLRQIYEVEEGIENRLLAHIKKANTFKEFMEYIKTKRYTWTRLQRICLHILTNTTKKEMKALEGKNFSTYIRLLGMTNNGQEYLRVVKKKLPVPLISNISGTTKKILDTDIKAASVYAMSLEEPLRSKFIHEEFSTPPIRYDKQSNSYF